MSVGFKIVNRTNKVSSDYVKKFAAIPVANISDSMTRMSAGGARIRPINPVFTLSGPALTVKTRPGDNLMVHKALDMAEPGDILVVDAGGDLTNAIIGELMVTHAKCRQLGGFIINGAVRDVAAIHAGDFPVFAAGVTHRGPYKDGPGEINTAVAIDGMVIQSGDLIVGDADGVLCVAASDVEEVYQAAKKKNDAEVVQMQSIKEGVSDRSWVDASLVRLKCEGV